MAGPSFEESTKRGISYGIIGLGLGIFAFLLGSAFGIPLSPGGATCVGAAGAATAYKHDKDK